MKTKETQLNELATLIGPRPGDFPIGSVHSRAAARAMLKDKQPKFTSYDLDCIEIVRMTGYLHAGAWPSYSEMEKLSVWQRGRELFQASEGHQEWLETLRQLGAGRPFNLSGLVRIKGWKPSDGDIFRWMENNPPVTAEGVDKWRVVWERLVPEYPFPFKYETGFLYVRLADYVLRERNKMSWRDRNETGARAIEGFESVWPPRLEDMPQVRRGDDAADQ